MWRTYATSPVVVEREVVFRRGTHSCELVSLSIAAVVLGAIAVTVGDWYATPYTGSYNRILVETIDGDELSSEQSADFQTSDHTHNLGNLYRVTRDLLYAAIIVAAIGVLIAFIISIRNCCTYGRNRYGTYLHWPILSFILFMVALVWTTLFLAAWINFVIHHEGAYSDDNQAFCNSDPGAGGVPPQCRSFSGDGYGPAYGFFLTVAASVMGLWSLWLLLLDMMSNCCAPRAQPANGVVLSPNAPVAVAQPVGVMQPAVVRQGMV